MLADLFVEHCSKLLAVLLIAVMHYSPPGFNSTVGPPHIYRCVFSDLSIKCIFSPVALEFFPLLFSPTIYIFGDLFLMLFFVSFILFGPLPP